MALTFHAVLLPKLNNLVKFVEESLDKDENLDKGTKTLLLDNFMVMEQDAEVFEWFVGEHLMAFWVDDPEKPGEKKFDSENFKINKKKTLLETLSKMETMGFNSPMLENNKKAASYEFSPEVAQRINQYFTMFCTVYSLSPGPTTTA